MATKKEIRAALDNGATSSRPSGNTRNPSAKRRQSSPKRRASRLSPKTKEGIEALLEQLQDDMSSAFLGLKTEENVLFEMKQGTFKKTAAKAKRSIRVNGSR